MKNFVIALIFIFSLSALAEINEFRCDYRRIIQGKEAQELQFRLMPSVPSVEKNLRTHGFSVKVKNDHFSIRVKEFNEIQVKSIPVQDVWGIERTPREVKAQFTFPKKKIEIICN